MDLNITVGAMNSSLTVSLREKGVDLNLGVLNVPVADNRSPFVRREWI